MYADHSCVNGSLQFGRQRNIAAALRDKTSIDMMRGARPALLAASVVAVLLAAVVALGSHHSLPANLRITGAVSVQPR